MVLFAKITEWIAMKRLEFILYCLRGKSVLMTQRQSDTTKSYFFEYEKNGKTHFISFKHRRMK